MFLTDNQLEEFKKTETFKMLIKGTYLGVMENDFKNMTKKQLVDECFKKEAQIFDLKDQLALTEKAFKLLCQNTGCMGCPLDSEDCDSWRGVEQSCSKAIHDYFMSKAKEMLKSE